MSRIKLAVLLMVPPAFFSCLAAAQEQPANCPVTNAPSSQLKSPPPEVYGPYVPYVGPALNATQPQRQVTEALPISCYSSNPQVSSPVKPASVPSVTPAPPQAKAAEVLPAVCSTPNTQTSPALKTQPPPEVYGPYVPYVGPLLAMSTPQEPVSELSAPPTACYSPASSLSNVSAVQQQPDIIETSGVPLQLNLVQPTANDFALATGSTPSTADPSGAGGFVMPVRTPEVIKEPSSIRPFRSLAIGFKATTLGTGIELATPVSRSFNLRSSINIFAFNYPFVIDGVNYDARLHLKSSGTTLDWFPGNHRFHISPGILYVKNSLTAPATVGAGQAFELGDQPFINSVDDPVGGSSSVIFPRKVAPMLLLGSGNIIPRTGRHFSVPFEFGAAYTGAAQISVALDGTACTYQGCVSFASNADAQASLKQEVYKLNGDLKRFPVYPILSLGLAYHF